MDDLTQSAGLVPSDRPRFERLNIDRAVHVLADYITESLKRKRKGDIAHAFLEVSSALRDLVDGRSPPPKCDTLPPACEGELRDLVREFNEDTGPLAANRLLAIVESVVRAQITQEQWNVRTSSKNASAVHLSRLRSLREEPSGTWCGFPLTPHTAVAMTVDTTTCQHCIDSYNAAQTVKRSKRARARDRVHYILSNGDPRTTCGRPVTDTVVASPDLNATTCQGCMASAAWRFWKQSHATPAP